MARARLTLTESLERDHATERLAREVGLSERHLRRQFTEVFSQTPPLHLNKPRHNHAADAAYHSRPESA